MLDLCRHLHHKELLLIAASRHGAITSLTAGGMLGSGRHMRAVTKNQARLRELYHDGYLCRARGKSSDGSLGYLYWPTQRGLDAASEALGRWPSPVVDSLVLDLPGMAVGPDDAAEDAMFHREWGTEATAGLAEAFRPHVHVERTPRCDVRHLWTAGPQYFGEGPDGSVACDGVVTFGRPFFDVLVLADQGGDPACEAVRVARLAALLGTPSTHRRYGEGLGLAFLVVSPTEGRAGGVAQAVDRLLVGGHAGVANRDIRGRVFCCGVEAIARPIARYRDDQVVRRMQFGRSRRHHWAAPTYRFFSLPESLPEPGDRRRMVNLDVLGIDHLYRAATNGRQTHGGQGDGVVSWTRS